MATSTDDLTIHLDAESKAHLTQAAALHNLSLGDYIRTVAVTQARRELDAATSPTITLSADEQRAFWQALHEPVNLTENQKALGALMRGE